MNVGVNQEKHAFTHYHSSLGVTINSNGTTRSVGSYGEDGNLNGLGVQYTKKGESFCGIFKNNLLVK